MKKRIYLLYKYTELIKIISPTKLKEGGADILEEQNKNHHKDKLGMIFINPLFINILRLWVRS